VNQGYPQAQNPFAPPQQDLPGPLDDMARKLPQSAPARCSIPDQQAS